MRAARAGMTRPSASSGRLRIPSLSSATTRTRTMSSVAEPVADVGPEMHALIGELFPICRSITGDGLRQTLRLLQQRVPMDLVEVPSGTNILHCSAQTQWDLRSAWHPK